MNDLTTTGKSFKLALIQMKVEGGKVNENLERAVKNIKEAAQNGASVVVLPELADLGWCHSSVIEQAESIPDGKTFKVLSSIAKENNIFLCSGISEKDHEQVFNSAVLIDPNGHIILKHRKINELNIAHDLYEQGNQLNIVNTELGTFGILICADAFADNYVLSESLGYMGADIILSPCAWAVPPNHDNERDPYGGLWKEAYGAVSSKFKLWFVGVSNVGKITEGEWNNWNCIGSSLVYDYNGNEVLQGPYGLNADTILYTDINLIERPARGNEWSQYWKMNK